LGVELLDVGVSIMVDTIADFKKCATDKPALRKWYQDRDTDIKQLNAQK
jgi:hypothetical protein